MIIVIHHLLTLMSDTSRFTPLYVVRMFLDTKYCENNNIFIPEAFLEHSPEFEKKLCDNLKKIDEIAKSCDSEKIIAYVIHSQTPEDLHECLRFNDLFYHPRCELYTNVESLMRHIKNPTIVNHDFIKDLIPVRAHILYGEYGTDDVFTCIFRYIMYIKTKHLCIYLDDIEINFRPFSCTCTHKIGKEYIFNY